MKIGLINVKYSENLGDGVIAECLETTLCNQPDVNVTSIDLSGRNAFRENSEQQGKAKSKLSETLRHGFLHLPNVLKDTLIYSKSLYDLKMKVSPTWKRTLPKYDAFVMGGGHLFGDYRMYFPMRINLIMRTISKTGKPIVVHAVGVNGNLNNKAKQHIGAIFDCNLRAVKVRSDNDFNNWNTQFPLQATGVVKDPAILSNEVYAEYLEDRSNSKTTVGVNIMNNTGIIRESDSPHELKANEILFFEVGQQLVQKGYKVVYFTNGALEDEKTKLKLEQLWQQENCDDVSFIDRMYTPKQLVVQISKFDAVVAHRLHSNIIAYSLRIPHVGLGWNSKVKDFFDTVQRQDFYLPSEGATAKSIVLRIEEALQQGIAPQLHHSIVELTRQEITRLTECFEK